MHLFFDGKNSKAYPVIIELLDLGIRITSSDGSDAINEFWNACDIHPTEFVEKNNLILRFGEDFPYQTLQIQDERLIQKLSSRYNLDKKAKKYNLINRNGWRGYFVGIAIIATFIFCLFKFIIPGVAQYAGQHLPVDVEESIGKHIAQSYLNNFRVDSAKTKALVSFYNKLNYTSDFTIKLYVVDFGEQNAFALPGGTIVVFSGIINAMDDPEQLAALIGHELAHVNKRHSTKLIFRNLSTYLFLSVLLNDVNGITAVLVDNLNTIGSLSYSRDLEMEADLEGLTMMHASGIEKMGMVQLMEQLMSISDGSIIPEFLSTHPISEKRLNYIKDEINEFPKYPLAIIGWEEEWMILSEF